MLPVDFERHQAGILHECGHAVLAVILDRSLAKVSIVSDKMGDGHVLREVHNCTLNDCVEEIAIALAGEEAPLLWGQGWITNAEHDYKTIEALMNRWPTEIRERTIDAIRSCVHETLGHARNAIIALGRKLLESREIDGATAEGIIRSALSGQSNLSECLTRKVPLF